MDNEIGHSFPDLTGLPRKQRLYFEHPDPCPDVSGPMPYLIHPPSRSAATQTWRDFRDRTVLPMIAAYPEDIDLPRFRTQVEVILAWRDEIPPEDRFWRPD